MRHVGQLRRKVLGVLLVSALVLGIGATPASAGGYGCAGYLQASTPIKYGSTTIGELRLYWDDATRRNCAATVHRGPTVGVTTFTSTLLNAGWLVIEPTGDRWINWDTGAGDYYGGWVKSYTYAAAQRDSSKLCIKVSGKIDWKGADRQAELGPGWCGGVPA